MLPFLAHVHQLLTFRNDSGILWKLKAYQWREQRGVSREDSYLVGFVGGIPNHIHLTPYQEGLRWCLVNIQSVDWVVWEEILAANSEVFIMAWSTKRQSCQWKLDSTFLFLGHCSIRSPTNYVEIIACMCDHLLGDCFAGHKLSFRAQRMS